MVPSKLRRKAPRRSAQAWQALLDERAESGLTVTAFCHQASISPASFYRWQGRLRKGLQNTGVNSAGTLSHAIPAVTAPQPIPDFVDLGALEDVPSPDRREAAATHRLELHLDLGEGLVLHLVRS
ncbi:hypothetical protein RIE95_15310 [Acidithiobacillus thiooxidans]|uniref:IS66 family insertion sequence element accessory protein TnpA n=1 Tax=Acidithiobacillus thiooxidans TaxID=930 RepID=UPI00285C8F83|nr:hypothetical protein [Acidithiobacillus thiooxidans]MDR7927077.1 hypothetical protein [Acidithiobacillus thiooxidans]MDR7928332.1 hypothetical protein [Acidithiobacillus thiooxidans]